MRITRCLILILSVVAMVSHGYAQPGEDQLLLTEQIELQRLVDLAAKRLRLNIEYDQAVLKGNVTLRLGGGISDEELWSLTNRLLAARGFTTVRAPGSDVVSVVQLTEANKFTTIRDSDADVREGYTSVAVRLRHKAVKDVIESARAVLSKPAGQAVPINDTLMLVSDLTPRIQEVLRVVELVDVAPEPIVMVEIPATNLTASQLDIVANQFVAKVNNLTTDKLVGELVAAADGKSLLLACRAADVERWRALVEKLDKREPVEARSYIPRYFELKEVRRLVEESIKMAGVDERLRIVADDLTGTLIVTATASQHEQIGTIIDRLNSIPPEGRRPMRIFKVRNRGVNEVLSVLQSLVATGDLAGDLVQPSESPRDAAFPSTPWTAVATPATSPPSTSAPAATPPDGTPNPSRADAAATVSRNQGRREGGRVNYGPSTTQYGGTGGSDQPAVVLTSDEGTSSIIAVGEPRLLSQIEKLIQQLDVRQPQVMVQALVVSLSDTQTQQLGIELEGQLNLSGDSILRLSSLFGLSSAGAQVGERTATGAGGTGLLLSPGEFAVVIRALETINKGRSVSMPQVLVNNNQQATFNSTTEQPYATILNGSGENPQTTFGGSSSAGTVVTAKPQIGEGDHLVLDYTVELSAFVGEASANLPPPKQTNNVASAVTLPDGFTVAVGGLELASDTQIVDQVPLLSQIPILGEAFKNRSNTTSRSRFFVFLRAEVMRHERFEDLKYLSQVKADTAQIDDGWPDLEPRVIR